VTGADVKESSLGKVRAAANADYATSAEAATKATNATNATNATHATSATTATNAGNAQTTDGRRLGCPAGTQEYAGVCIETTARAAASWYQASVTCGDLNRTIPTPSQLEGFRLQPGITLGSPEEATSVVVDFSTEVVMDDKGYAYNVLSSTELPFRCATSLVR